jgi:hypothetical protein
MQKDPKVKAKFEETNPPVYTTPSKRRLVNQMWRHYSRQRKKLSAPLPKVELEQIHHLAVHNHKLMPRSRFQEKVERELLLERERTGRYQGKWHNFTPRFIRRCYQRLLINNYFPIMAQTNDKWTVGRMPKITLDRYPALDPKHLAGFKLTNGVEKGRVDENGAFVERDPTFVNT